LKISKKTAIIIPIKKYEKSKTRLSPYLSFEERKCLTRMLVLDTLEKVYQLKNSQTIVVLSEILQLPNKFNDMVIIDEDSSGNGVNDAIKLANSFIDNNYHCFSESIILPIDLPLFYIEDLQKIINYSRRFENCICIVPSKRYDGTNLLLRKPNSIVDTFYDNNSFYNHIKAANEKRLIIKIFNYQSLMIDLDTFEDIIDILKICKNMDYTLKLKKYKLKESRSLNFLKDLIKEKNNKHNGDLNI
jgi:2-phospho-L-lactate guanylyltransferase